MNPEDIIEYLAHYDLFHGMLNGASFNVNGIGIGIAHANHVIWIAVTLPSETTHKMEFFSHVGPDELIMILEVIRQAPGNLI